MHRQNYCFAGTDYFHADDHRGTMAKPVVLQLGEATRIDTLLTGKDTDTYYDLQGRKVDDIHRKGVYINVFS